MSNPFHLALPAGDIDSTLKFYTEILGCKTGNKENAEKEFGDVLFSMINYARFIGVNPENALEKTNKKFINRFQYLEKAAKKEGKELSDMSLTEMDVYWNESKKYFS